MVCSGSLQTQGCATCSICEGNSRPLSRPLMAVCWNSLEDDREAKETMLRELVGDYVGIE